MICTLYNSSVDGAKLDGDLKAEVPYKSIGSKCGLSNNSPLEFKADRLTCHTLLSMQRSIWKARWLVHC